MIEKVQIKYDGRVHEFHVDELDLNPNSSSDAQVIQAVERRLDAGSLSEFQVEPPEGHQDRSSVTVLNLRPSAPFGKNSRTPPTR